MTGPGPDADPVARLGRVVKSYDVRGLVPTELDATVARALGCGLAAVVAPEGPTAVGAPRAVVLGRDMRESSPALASALGDGVRSSGLDVLDIGLASSDLLYFASGSLDLPAAMVTASHNPAGWNGVKMCRAGARPVGAGTGLERVREVAQAVLSDPRTDEPPVSGRVHRLDLLEDYAAHLLRLAPLPPRVSGRRPLRVVVDAGNGMAGHTVPAVLGGADVELHPLHFELDGRFPHHPANPLDPSTLTDLRAAVRRRRADVGLAFDGDADRCVLVDERADVVPSSAVVALIARRQLAREPGAVVLHNLICSRAVPEVIRSHGGVPVRTPVGHSGIKARMAATGAVFGGEHSGHFYFRDFWGADSGLLAALHVLGLLADAGAVLSSLVADVLPYASSGEVNREVDDPALTTATVEAAFAAEPGVSVDHLDGVTVQHADWWFNVRPSGTEPLLRLNVEARDPVMMAAVRDRVLDVLRSAG